MGDINLDFTKNKLFLAIPYGSAAAGVGIALATTPATGPLGIAAACAIGAVAGGIGIPCAVMAVGFLATVAFVGIRETVKALAKEAPLLPMGMALVGLNCAKAIFVTPFQAAAKLFKGFGKKKEEKAGAQPAAKAPPKDEPSKPAASAAPAFKQAQEAKPAAEEKKAPPPAPQPPTP